MNNIEINMSLQTDLGDPSFRLYLLGIRKQVVLSSQN